MLRLIKYLAIPCAMLVSGNIFATVQCPETIKCVGTGTSTGACTSTIDNWVGSFVNYISPVSGAFIANWTTGGGEANAWNGGVSCNYAYPDSNGNTVVSILPNDASAYAPDTKSPGNQWVKFAGGQWMCMSSVGASPGQCQFLVNGK